jgi:PIN domain nuclease of toxin-antitoxin system
VEGTQVIVLDTCAIIWDALSPQRLSKRAKQAIASANRRDGITFCEISLWEIAMLMRHRRLDPGTDYRTFIDLVLSSNRYVLIGITPEIAEQSVKFPDAMSSDPADRIIAATAIVRGVPLVTADKTIRLAGCVPVVW